MNALIKLIKNENFVGRELYNIEDISSSLWLILCMLMHPLTFWYDKFYKAYDSYLVLGPMSQDDWDVDTQIFNKMCEWEDTIY